MSPRDHACVIPRFWIAECSELIAHRHMYIYIYINFRLRLGASGFSAFLLSRSWGPPLQLQLLLALLLLILLPWTCQATAGDTPGPGDLTVDLAGFSWTLLVGGGAALSKARRAGLTEQRSLSTGHDTTPKIYTLVEQRSRNSNSKDRRIYTIRLASLQLSPTGRR